MGTRAVAVGEMVHDLYKYQPEEAPNLGRGHATGSDRIYKWAPQRSQCRLLCLGLCGRRRMRPCGADRRSERRRQLQKWPPRGRAFCGGHGTRSVLGEKAVEGAGKKDPELLQDHGGIVYTSLVGCVEAEQGDGGLWGQHASYDMFSMVRGRRGRASKSPHTATGI